MSQDRQNESKKSYKDTLNLPKTDFPIRPNNAVDDPKLIARWTEEQLFRKSFDLHQGSIKYVLHDGPPYANGDIHLGHAYNKILKDITCKARRMCGYHVPVTPGWDCHGLPIEQKVAQKNPQFNKVEMKKACREYADYWINVQRKSFKEIGVLMDWDRPYITMSPSYEADIIRAFAVLVKRDFIERKNKTVPWCFHDKTVLAAAEIEYKDRKDPSIYVLFDLQAADIKTLFPDITGKQVSVVIWTTTPWTLPLNQAVLAHPKAHYVLLEFNQQYIIVGREVADNVCKLLQIEKKVVREFPAEYIKNVKLNHPFVKKVVPLILDDSVGTDDGTAFVHCAPGCGPIDYEIGVKNNLEIFSPISDDGRYTEGIEPQELANMLVTDAQIWVIKKLAELGRLIYKTTIHHSYPHCWRCHNGLIFRATPQWFIDLNKEGIKQQALDAIEKIKFIPDRSRNFLKATVESRWEWCISRQRVWGVPIPALLCSGCLDYAYMNEELVKKVADGVACHGIEYWDTVEIKDLITNDIKCPCGSSEFVKEQDILDVWFESGISHYAVLYNNPELAYPADLYLEGVDQHRAWFQSSLLTSLVVEKEPAMKAIMSHGYTVDAKGQKMSKSLGNVVAPEDIIKKIGTDGLRLWVASIGHDSDPVVSEVLFNNVAEVYRKIRNTCRFALQNLFDFDIEHDAVSIDRLLPTDRYALTQLSILNGEIIEQYLHADYTAVFHKLAEYCAVDLSSFYYDIAKDRLYTEVPDGLERRSAQTVLWCILDTITRLSAPIMSFTAELVSDEYQKNKKDSIHLQTFVNPEKLYNLSYGKEEHFVPALISLNHELTEIPYSVDQDQHNKYYNLQWQTLKDVRSVILKAIEIEREKGLIKHSLEAHVALAIDFSRESYTPLKDLFNTLVNNGVDLVQLLKEILIVSQVTYDPTQKGQDLGKSATQGIHVTVTKADGVKCPRCWQYDITDHPDHLCNRCQRVLSHI